jgi:hypothetical protein
MLGNNKKPSHPPQKKKNIGPLECMLSHVLDYSLDLKFSNANTVIALKDKVIKVTCLTPSGSAGVLGIG